MFSELFDGEIVYTKRFPISNEIDELAEAAAVKKDTAGASAACESFVEYMWRSDEKCVYILRPDGAEFCQKFIDYAKSFSEEFKVGIDVVNNRFSYVVKLYIDFALFRGRYKEMMTCLMVAADEISIDQPNGDDCETVISLRCYTHDLYYDGRRRPLC